MNNTSMLKPKDVSAILGVSVRTLIRWDKSKKLVAHRTPTNRRYYTRDQINAVLHPDQQNTHSRINIAYTRVLTRNQLNDFKINEILLKITR